MNVKELVGELNKYHPNIKACILTENNDILEIKSARYLIDNDNIVCCVMSKEREVE